MSNYAKDSVELLLVNKYRIFEVESLIRHVDGCISYQKELNISFRTALEEERRKLEKELDVCVRVFNDRLERMFLNKYIEIVMGEFSRFGFITEINSNGVMISGDYGNDLLCLCRRLVKKFITGVVNPDKIFDKIFIEYLVGFDKGTIDPIGFDENGNIADDKRIRDLCDYLETRSSGEMYR